MNCEDIQNLFESQALQELTRQDLDSVEEHANTCPECQLLLEGETKLQHSLQSLAEPAVPDELVAAVMARIEKGNETSAQKTLNLSLPETAPWPIALLITGFTITLGLYSYQFLVGQSPLFNMYSLWNGEWTQWLITPLQLNLVGLGLGCGFVFYVAGFLMMLEQREFSN